jgi:phosphatidylglycerophosphate synthase
MKTFPKIPWWTWLIIIIAADLLQSSLMFLPLRSRGTTPFTSRALLETATFLFPVIISIFAWRKNQETPSYILYGILLAFITSGANWAISLVKAGIQWTGAPYWVAVLLMTLLAFSFIAYVLLRKSEFPRIGKTAIVLSILTGALIQGLWLFAPEPPETGYDFYNYNWYLESWQYFVMYHLLSLFMFAYCCIKLIRAKDNQD